MNRLTVFAVCSASVALAPLAAAQSPRVVAMPFPIAGDQVLYLPVTDDGPLPAEAGGLTVRVAGFSVEHSKQDPTRARFRWTFQIFSKSPLALESVLVEEVFPTDVARVLVTDRAPVLHQDVWLGASAAVEADRAGTAWLFEDKPSAFVFRLTVKARGERAIVLHQPTLFSRSMKQALRQELERLRGSKPGVDR
jgi:hypothetical protein